MEIYLTLTYWLFMYQVWLIIGIGMIALEITDGSAIFFLPLGLAAFGVSSLLLLVDYEIIPNNFVPNAWYWLLAIWIALAVALSFLISFWRSKKREIDDINRY